MKMRASIFAVILLSASSAVAGAWVQPNGKGIAITQATYYTTSSYFDSDGIKQPQPRYSKFELQPYAEYGLTDTITLGGSAYLQSVAQSGEKNRGIADPELFARARVYADNRQVLSLQPLLKLPGHFSDSASPRGGSRSMDMELSALYGRNQPILTANDYTDLRIGYRTRSRGLSDQLRVDAVLGIKLNETWEIAPAIRGVLAINPTDEITFSENGELDYSVLKSEVNALYHLNEAQWLQAGFFQHVAGIQTGDGFGITVGFAQRF